MDIHLRTKRPPKGRGIEIFSFESKIIRHSLIGGLGSKLGVCVCVRAELGRPAGLSMWMR